MDSKLQGTRPTVPEVLPVAVEYLRNNGAWGSLHIMLDDGNDGDSVMEFCQQHALDRGDILGYALATLMRHMSHSQRRRVGHHAEAVLREMRKPVSKPPRLPEKF